VSCSWSSLFGLQRSRWRPCRRGGTSSRMATVWCCILRRPSAVTGFMAVDTAWGAVYRSPHRSHGTCNVPGDQVQGQPGPTGQFHVVLDRGQTLCCSQTSLLVATPSTPRATRGSRTMAIRLGELARARTGHLTDHKQPDRPRNTTRSIDLISGLNLQRQAHGRQLLVHQLQQSCLFFIFCRHHCLRRSMLH
jgi:hypothetical protein